MFKKRLNRNERISSFEIINFNSKNLFFPSHTSFQKCYLKLIILDIYCLLLFGKNKRNMIHFSSSKDNKVVYFY